MKTGRTREGRLVWAIVSTIVLSAATGGRAQPLERSVARQWNEELLSAIRADFARPTVHARNLWHVSIAMWDAWAAYDAEAEQYLHHEKASADDIPRARAEATGCHVLGSTA